MKNNGILKNISLLSKSRGYPINGYRFQKSVNNRQYHVWFNATVWPGMPGALRAAINCRDSFNACQSHAERMDTVCAWSATA